MGRDTRKIREPGLHDQDMLDVWFVGEVGTEWAFFRCPRCGIVLDRDLNAALNIAKRGLTQDEGLRFGRNRPPSEAVNLPLRRRGADGGEVRLAAKNS